MGAEVVRQRVALMGRRSWMMWRAVCGDGPVLEPLIPSWQASDLHPTWIGAKIDAVAHDLNHHAAERRPEPTFDELIAPTTRPLLSSRSNRGRHHAR